MIQNPLYINKNTYSNTASSAELNNYTLTDSDKGFNAAKQLNKGIVDKLLEDANNMEELVGLNNYVDEIKVKPRKNFILARNLELSQVFNRVSIKNHFPKAKLIPARELKIQMPTADIIENSGAKPFLERT